nr:glycosyltransferase [Asticcacaulis aquaticus]
MRALATTVPPRARDFDAFLDASNENLPTYSVIVALYKEAKIVPQLTAALDALVYPRDRLEVLFALEDDDHETLIAFEDRLSTRADLSHMRVVRVPHGFPRTKPRALNHALAQAQGDLIVIYDAEDQPGPPQLLEAAHRFATGPADLACLQAPLRPLRGNTFISKQFTAEYAVQFDVLLPAFQAWGLPFALGGTSNHFKAPVLKAIGAWDAYNVTEDADLGLRLAQYGHRSALIATPTLESPPTTLTAWIPQRTRWIKGYIQTIIVHTRRLRDLRPDVAAALSVGIGLSALSALCYAPFTALLLANALLQVLEFGPFILPLQDWALLIIGTGSALWALKTGTRRAGVVFTTGDLLHAPVYWALQSISAAFALYQLVTRPFHWDKTDHEPVGPAEDAHAE